MTSKAQQAIDLMFYTSLNKIRAHHPCQSGWEKLLKYLGKTQTDDEPLAFTTVLEANGFKDAMWCCQCAPEHGREWRLFAVWCALQVRHLMTDKRSFDALEVAERYANGLASDEELNAARSAADSAAHSAARSAQKEVFLWIVSGGLAKWETK